VGRAPELRIIVAAEESDFGPNANQTQGDIRMSDPRQVNSPVQLDNQASGQSESTPGAEGLSRRNFLGVGSAGLATAALATLSVNAQERALIEKGEHDHSASNPGPENKPLLEENPASNMPPVTDYGNVIPIWYSFDLPHMRIEEGGWTNQVTETVLPSSKDIAGVRMRLTAGSFRELHWHTSDEWAIVLTGSTRVTVLNPDGTIFIGDVGKGDLWYFPAGFPHSIQGLGPDGSEFMLIFNQGNFSEDATSLISQWVQHTPPSVVAKNFGLPESSLKNLPTENLYIFPADVPPSLEQDKAAVGGSAVASPYNYTFKLSSMAPTSKTRGGEIRMVDSHTFTAAKNIAGALATIKPGGLREMHWHPNASEWQYYISGKGRMTIVLPDGARTMDFNANDVGFVPRVVGHYIENTGDTDLQVLEMFATGDFQEISLNNWVRRLPPEMVTAHLKLDPSDISKISADPGVFILPR
jgi:oxalate decarboxylase